MKFKKTIVFDSIEAARLEFCPNTHGEHCVTCPIGLANNSTIMPCNVYAQNHPAEAARLMGYEVIEEPNNDKEDTMTDKPKNTANPIKPLPEWTLGEVQSHCANTKACADCILCETDIDSPYPGVCLLRRAPSLWGLLIRNSFPTDELEMLKTFRKLLGADAVTRDADGNLYLESDGNTVAPIFPQFFPIIPKNTTVTLRQILGDEK